MVEIEIERRLAGLSPAKRKALLKYMKERGHVTSVPRPAEEPSGRTNRPDPAVLARLPEGVRGVEDVYPLSPLQQGMLFHSLYRPGVGEYVQQLSFTFTGPLDPVAVRRAVEEVVRRHPPLRTAFFWNGLDEPLQAVFREVELPWDEQDWRDLSEAEVEERLARELRDDARRGFELGQAPLLRLRLFRTGERRHRFVWCFHHLLLDGWSFLMVLRETLSLYTGLAEGRQVAAAPRRPLGDFVAWLRQRDGAAATAYWRRTLAGFTAPSLLAGERKASPEAAGPEVYQVCRHGLQGAPAAALQAFAARHRLTLNVLFQGAWSLLLGRSTGAEDVLFGLTTSGRSSGPPWVDSMIGMFMNTLPLRVRVPLAAPLVPWLRRLQASQAELLEHEHSPLEEVQRLSDVPPGQPLFDSLLVSGNFPVDASLPPAGGELELGDFRYDERTNYPLTVAVTPTHDLEVVFSYDRERFDRTTVRRLQRHFVKLLESLSATLAERRLGEIPWISAAETQQTLVEWNDTAVAAVAPASTLADLLDAQAARTPEACALVCGDERLSYRELDRRAERLGRALRARGVGPDVRVGVCAERSTQLVVALVAVLKAGGAYLPLDPDTPGERLAFMVRSARAAVVLTRERWLPTLPELPCPVLCLDAGEPAPRDDGPWRPVLVPDNLAYVIYTSGSTGEPKGSMISHRAIVNRLRWMQAAYRLQPGEAVLQKTPFTFDVSVWEFFWPLLVGARLVVARPDGHRDSAYMARLVVEEEVTTLHFVPSMLQVFLDEPALDESRLRRVIASGEALPAALRDRFQARFAGRGVELHNLYGPTEAAVDVTFFPCREDGRSGVPIGRPIANLRTYVCDRWGQPLPIGMAGELLLGGVGLARGYLGRPATTARSFVPDSLSGEAGGRLYRTGDLTRLGGDGEIDFLGRIDHQVKLRGLRIELGEVEVALSRHGAVRECVVTVERDSGSGHLAAFLVPATAAPPPLEELREELRRTLPEHMVPASFTVLEALPRTASGKLDRRRLVAAAPATSFSAPRTPAEKLLAAIWSQLLSRPRVGTEDNFFTLGGDSILSIQVVSRARHEGLQIAVQDLFRHPTLGALAAVARWSAPPAACERGVVVGEVPLTPVQRWFFESRPARPAHFNQALLLAGREPLVPRRLAAALAVLLEHHDALRLRFSRDAGTWRQAIDPPGAAAPFARVDLTALPAARRRPALASAADVAQSSLDLARGPLLRLVLFELAAAETRLLWVIHHLAVDGVSWRVLLEDLERLYRQSQRGEPFSLPPRTTSFKQWAERLEAHAAGVGGHLGFWLEQAAPAPPLPVDRHGAANTVASARTVSVTLPADETRVLLREVHSAYRTGVTDFLLAALVSAFASWTGEPTLLVDLEGHGREPFEEGLDSARTVGWFTTVFPLRLTCDTDPGVLLKTTKERRRALPAGGLSWGLLRHLDAAAAARLRELPGAEVLFNYLGQLDAGLPPGSFLGVAAESAGAMAAAGAGRRHLLEVDCGVTAGGLEVSFTYSESRHRRATIEALAAGFLVALRRLLAHCRQPGAGGLTPSDVPESGLGQAAIDELLGRLATPPETLYPLSPAQQGMLFFALLERQGSALFNNQMCCVLNGPLDAALFREAWSRVVRRHETLRAFMVWEDLERPVQVISRRVEIPWIVEDYRALPATTAGERLAALVESDRYQGLDLGRAPLMRLTLVRTAELRHHFIWTHHQTILDGWSVQRVLAEVFAAYRARLAGTEPQWAAPVPYRSYIAWIERQDPRAAEAFWRQRLAGAEPSVGLGVERRGEGLQLGAATGSRLDPVSSGRLEALSRRAGLTASTLFQGAWVVLLSRYSGRPEVISGTVVAGRPAELPGYESIVGLCINVLPVRCRLAGGTAVAAWLSELQAEMARLRRFEHCAVEQIQRWLGASWEQPLFDNLFVFENYPVDTSLLANDTEVTVEQVEVEEAPNYPLNLFVSTADPPELRLVYDAGRFDPATARRLLDHLQRLLEQISGGTGRLGELTLLSPREREQLLSLRATTPDVRLTARPAATAVHLEIARRAALSPAATAAVSPEGEELSYGELERWSNGVAHRLLELGVGPETVVGLYVERSFALLAGMLGVLKAGGCYLPLDPGNPEERLAFQIEDAGARVILTGGAEHGLPLAGRPVVRLTEATPRDGDFADRFLAGEQSAYVIYTSGSTGRPKGVVVSHGSLAAHAAGAAESYGVVAADRVLQFASLSFDASVEEIYPTLLRGAALVLRRAALDSTSAFLADGRARGVTVLNLPTAYWHTLTADAEAAGRWLQEVRLVILGGEEARLEALRGFRRWVGPEVALVNTYGPTETTVVATRWHAPADAELLPRLPIGRPVDGARAYVLDRGLEPVAAGVPGEICLGGYGVARGYLRRPAATAARFVPDPFAGAPGARLYRSGDRGRWQEEQLEFLGRLDHQLKVRGYRVEAGEVEAAILRHPPVREAVVVSRDDIGESRLVAYVSGSPELAVEPLRAFLATRCPEHMVPHTFVVLDELPRGVGGKLERRALPPPAATNGEGVAYVEPRSEVEEVLAEIFADLLGQQRVGVHDDFFELGGHSLLATRLATRVRNTFAVEMALAEIFTARTVAALGLVVERHLIAQLEAMSDEEVERFQQQT